MAYFNESSAYLLKSLIDAGITSPQELANVMGNASVETWHYSTMEERFNYRSADQLIGKVSSVSTRFSRQEIEAAISGRDSEAIANMMYDNRRDIGNINPGDGWSFHGRGYFQLTGRSNYDVYGRVVGVDLISNPELASSREVAAKLAIAYWREKVPEHSRTDVRAAAFRINGGDNGLGERITSVQDWINTITPALVSDIQNGTISLQQLASMRDARALHQGMHGDDVKHVQDELARLGYTDARGQSIHADGSFGPATRYAVEGFQRDRGLDVDGIAGPVTQGVIDAALKESHRATARLSPSSPTFADPEHPQHAVYAKLKEVLPMGTSEARLAQFTSACHLAGMDRPDDISAIHIGKSEVVFMPRSLIGVPASVDLLEPAPVMQASMQQAQTYDQQCVQSMAQFQAQQQQINAQVQQGPVLGGPSMQ